MSSPTDRYYIINAMLQFCCTFRTVLFLQMFITILISLTLAEASKTPSNQGDESFTTGSVTVSEVVSPSTEGAEKQTEMNYVASCLGDTIHPTEGFSSFTTGGVYRCWLYCKATSQCTALTFDTLNGRCSLLDKDNYDDMKLTEQVRGGQQYIVSRKCMKTADKQNPGKNLTEIEALSKSGAGFLVQRFSGEKICCLIKLAALEDISSFPVIWGSCETGSRWLLTKGKYQEEEQKDVIYYQISLASSPDLCLDVNKRVGLAGYSFAMATKCRKITFQMNDTQVMNVFGKVGNYTIYFAKLNDEFYAGGEHAGLLSTEYLKFKDPGLYQGAGKSVCKLAQFSTDHGALRNRENVTFYLPGDVVEVQCDPGYGVRKLNFSSLQTITCSRTARPRSCTRIKREDKNDQGRVVQHVLLTVVLTIAIISAVFNVVLLMYFLSNRSKRIKRQGMDGMEMDTIKGEKKKQEKAKTGEAETGGCGGEISK